MLDKDLVILYGVETKVLSGAVKRNVERYFKGSIFQLSREEFDNLRFHFCTSRCCGQPYFHYVSNENGVAMLLSELERTCRS